MPDAQIAHLLNRTRVETGYGNAWTRTLCPLIAGEVRGLDCPILSCEVIKNVEIADAGTRSGGGGTW